MTRRHLSIFGPDDEQALKMIISFGEPVVEYEVLAFFGATRDGE